MAGFPPNLTQNLGQDPSTQEIPQQFDPRTREIAGGLTGGRYRGQDENAILDRLTEKIIAQESSGRSWIVGKQGEIGLGQIMPSTAAQYGVQAGDLYNPKVNRALTRRILGDLYHRFNGNLFLTAAAYNTGPGNVNRGRIPTSTRAYASKAIQGLGDVFGGTPAYAEEPPAGTAPAAGAPPAPGAIGAPPGPLTKAPTTYLRGAEPPPTPGPAAAARRAPQGPVDMSRLAAMTAHLPPDRQQRIRDKALGINQRLAQSSADPAVRQKLLKSGGLPPDIASLLKTGESPEDIATDIKNPIYGYLRRPGTKIVGKLGGALWPRFGPTTPEYDRQVQNWWGHTFMPQTPTQAALVAATGPMGWAEAAPELAPEALQGLEGLSAARQALRPAVSTVPRRLLAMGGVGAVAKPAFGEGSPWQGFKEGVGFQAPGEVLAGVAGGAGRLLGKKALLSQTENDISKAMAEKLPVKVGPGGFQTDRPFDLRDWKLPDKAFSEVQDMLRPERDMIHMDPRVQKERFWMPIVKGGGDPGSWDWGWMGMKNAEEQLTKLGELGYLKSGEWATRGYSRDARALFDSRRAYIAGKLPQDIREMWELTRDQSGAAAAYRRLFQETKAINPNTGEFDQPKLAAGIKENWGDLQRQLGRKGVQDLWDATTRAKPRGPLYRGSPYQGGYEDRPGHWKPRFHAGFGKPGFSILPETYKPIGNVPIWMYPPRAPFAFAAGPYVRSKTRSHRLPTQGQ